MQGFNGTIEARAEAGGDLNGRFANAAVSWRNAADRLELRAQAQERQRDIDLAGAQPGPNGEGWRDSVRRTYDGLAAQLRAEAQRYRDRAAAAERGLWLLTGEPNADAAAINADHGLFQSATLAGRVTTAARGVPSWQSPTPAAAGEHVRTTTPGQ